MNGLGFTQSWRYENEGKAFVAQVDRQGCALIFSSQWPEKVSNGLMFISLGADVALDKLRAELESKGVDVKDGWWGYPLLVVRDPDGNELLFQLPRRQRTARRRSMTLQIAPYSHSIVPGGFDVTS